MKSGLFSLLLIALALPCGASSVGITTQSVPNGTINTKYAAAVAASGGCTPYTWAIVSGKLPAGITRTPSANTTSLNLTGTPISAATYSFTVAVTGCGKRVSQKSYQMKIQPAPNHVVDLSWKASTSTNVAGYNVYRSPDAATWKKINAGLVASTLFNDSTVANASTYYYVVTAVNIQGHESSRTPAVKAVIP